MDKNKHWASSIVWYQIFPERFHKNPKKQLTCPSLADLHGAWPHDMTSDWAVSPWGASWHDFHPHEDPQKSIFHHIQRRRYAGNLAGIIEKLDYLKTLGVEGIYLNPVFYAPSAHKYDAKMLHHIEPFFGPDPENDKKIIEGEVFNDEKTWRWTSADLLALELVDKAHELGLRVIFDGVFNHLGKTSPIFQDVEVNQENSEFSKWFQIESFRTKTSEFEYKGWFGVKELPQFLQTSEDLSEGPKAYIFKITERWMSPSVSGVRKRGIDGWRLDVAYCVNHGFWKKWRKWVLELNPEAFLTGELIDNFENVAEYLKGDEFDSVMNYNFWQAVIEFFVFERMKPTSFASFWEEMLLKLPPNSHHLLQNLLGSHDTARILTIIKNRGGIKSSAFDFGKFFNETTHSANKTLALQAPEAEDVKIFKTMVAFQMCFIGSPMIFYGDEVGMWGANDPDCRKPMVWEEIPYDDESHGKVTSKVSVNKELREFYQRLLSLRKHYRSLREGEYKVWLKDDSRRLFGFTRILKEQKVLVVFNTGVKEQELDIPALKEVIFGEGFVPKGDNCMVLMLSPRSFVITCIENE